MKINSTQSKAAKVDKYRWIHESNELLTLWRAAMAVSYFLETKSWDFSNSLHLSVSALMLDLSSSISVLISRLILGRNSSFQILHNSFALKPWSGMLQWVINEFQVDIKMTKASTHAAMSCRHQLDWFNLCIFQLSIVRTALTLTPKNWVFFPAICNNILEFAQLRSQVMWTFLPR